jgi:hypothetical protein
MIMTLRSWSGEMRTVTPEVQGLQPGLYGIYVDGILVETAVVVPAHERVKLNVSVGEAEVDLVVLRID